MDTSISPELDAVGADFRADQPPSQGAQFSVIISPENDSRKWVTLWDVEFKSNTTDWRGSLSSLDPAKRVLQTPHLSGLFTVTVRAEVGPRPLLQPLKPRPPSTNQIGCNSNCRSFVVIVADANHLNAVYTTIDDGFCSRTS